MALLAGFTLPFTKNAPPKITSSPCIAPAWLRFPGKPVLYILSWPQSVCYFVPTGDLERRVKDMAGQTLKEICLPHALRRYNPSALLMLGL